MTTVEPTAPAGQWIPELTFAARLILIRRQLGLSQVEAAGKCSIHPATWATWELGKSPRNMAEVVSTISRELGVDRDWLMWARLDGGSVNGFGSCTCTRSDQLVFEFDDPLPPASSAPLPFPTVATVQHAA